MSHPDRSQGRAHHTCLASTHLRKYPRFQTSISQAHVCNLLQNSLSISHRLSRCRLPILASCPLSTFLHAYFPLNLHSSQVLLLVHSPKSHHICLKSLMSTPHGRDTCLILLLRSSSLRWYTRYEVGSLFLLYLFNFPIHSFHLQFLCFHWIFCPFCLFCAFLTFLREFNFPISMSSSE